MQEIKISVRLSKPTKNKRNSVYAVLRLFFLCAFVFVHKIITKRTVSYFVFSYDKKNATMVLKQYSSASRNKVYVWHYGICLSVKNRGGAIGYGDIRVNVIVELLAKVIPVYRVYSI